MVIGRPHGPARVVIAAPASGHGKTTVATGLMAALQRAGHRVSGHKIGPDFIDPGYHALATGQPGRNLDPHLVGDERIVPLLLHGARHADIAVIEGVMGLHDGQIGTDGYASTAHVATMTGSPVVMVIDISHASRSIAAVVAGMAQFAPDVHIGGVILNKAGSQRHADEVCRALTATGIPVLGVLFRDDGVSAPSRHLGLVPAAERGDAAHALDRLADKIRHSVDLAQLVQIGNRAENLTDTPWQPRLRAAAAGAAVQPVIAVAGGRAFTFRYAETTELLESAGMQVAEFDPLTDESLPERTQGIYLGGGFPEVHAAGLSANEPLRHALRDHIDAGMPVVAECAGLLYLCESMDGAAMVGAIAAHARMTPRLTLAYRDVQAPHDHLLAAADETVTGHEYHRTTIDPAGTTGWISQNGATGFGSASMHASYIHTHWAGHPQLAERFCAAVRAYTPTTTLAGAGTTVALQPATQATSATAAPSAPSASAPDPLSFHGDAELDAGLVDFAVNIDDSGTPHWLLAALRSSIEEISQYPDASDAQTALARRHGRSSADVVPTAGGAEAFGLLARCRSWQRPVIVHPQFTEPDLALEAAGYQPEHIVLEHESGFVFDPATVPDDADLVIIGNPTNPTSVLHPRAAIAQLARPGRLVVVDEAFMDAVPQNRPEKALGEPQSWASSPRPGLAVIRSLTKTWAIPGVRAGYVLTDADTAELLRRQQPPWSVSTAAAAAMTACSSDAAIAETHQRARRIAANRDVLMSGLAELGVRIAGQPAAPFVLAQLGATGHGRLRAAGYAVRRADTFPGLDGSWVRIAVRAPETTHKLLAVLRSEGAPWI